MLVNGRYLIKDQLGRGGTSCVYLAEDTATKGELAIKEVYKSALTGSGEDSGLYEKEAGFLKKLSHPGLPRVYEIIPTSESFLVVMDFVPGISLDKVLEKYGACREEHVIDWGKQLCGVLSYLHSQDPPIIYRDMKPSNVILKADGTVVLIDFGVAREHKINSRHDTTLLGTYGFAAPEQFSDDRQSDARTDVYGLGVTMFNLVTGRDPYFPFYGVTSICEVNPALSAGLDEVIQKSMKLNPDERYQSAAEMKAALERVASGTTGATGATDSAGVSGAAAFASTPAFANASGAPASGAVNTSGAPAQGNATMSGCTSYQGGAGPSAYGPSGYAPSPAAPQPTAGYTPFPAAPQPSAKKRSLKWLWALTAIPATALIVLIIFLVARGGNTKTVPAETKSLTTDEIRTTDADTADTADTGDDGQVRPGDMLTQEVTISEAGGHDVYTVDLDVSGYYNIYSVSDEGLRPVGWFFDEDFVEIASSNVEGGRDELSIRCVYISADETYYLDFALASADATGKYDIFVELVSDDEEGERAAVNKLSAVVPEGLELNTEYTMIINVIDGDGNNMTAYSEDLEDAKEKVDDAKKAYADNDVKEVEFDLGGVTWKGVSYVFYDSDNFVIYGIVDGQCIYASGYKYGCDSEEARTFLSSIKYISDGRTTTKGDLRVIIPAGMEVNAEYEDKYPDNGVICISDVGDGERILNIAIEDEDSVMTGVAVAKDLHPDCTEVEFREGGVTWKGVTFVEDGAQAIRIYGFVDGQCVRINGTGYIYDSEEVKIVLATIEHVTED